ncbi:UDP-N-acetylglucosamine 2-epimerase [Hahella sp. NBU794]|uniref:UDP-N-acetylglucosamine 2-epimerase n=1 Tax=Hahella sp. NBU794 TaxID=3422590 RepID=UPI003D6DBBC7
MTRSRRKICVVTGARADYGLLYWLLKEIEADNALILQLVATGMHLSPEFGSTWKQIEADGFHISEKVEMLLSGDSPQAISKSVGLGVIGLADAYARLQPDLLVLLGDRFEALAAAQAAMLARIPIAHVHGGELTEGAVDESIRHAITKMSQLHFVAAEAYRRRVIQLGENPQRVFNVGAPGVENIRRLPLLSKDEVATRLKVDMGRPVLLITYHPETLSETAPVESMRTLLSALDEYPNALKIFTYPNADAYGRELIDCLLRYQERHGDNVLVSSSLGQLLYLSVMRCADAVVGNSSSGLIEAPALGRPTVNIGGRQGGRLQAASVIQCEEERASIVQGIARALEPEFLASLNGMTPPYGGGDTARQIAEVLKQAPLKSLLLKPFYDLPQGDVE